MPKIYYRSVPFIKEDVTLALESGVDAIIVDEQHVEITTSLARIDVFSANDYPLIEMKNKEDEEAICDKLLNGESVILAEGYEIIPVENLLARSSNVLAEVSNVADAKLACGILECGVYGIVIGHAGINNLKNIVEQCKQSQGQEELEEAEIIEIATIGLGHRVCVDTLSILKRGQGMLIGNSSAFTYLVHGETESNEYVAARPFRVNAGAVHAYVKLADDRTCYLEELRAGDEVLTVNADGSTSIVTVGRVKIELRPMLKIVAKIGDAVGAIFLQNAETIRLTMAGGIPVSVVSLKIGDKILCNRDEAGRHFGMRIVEDIKEL